MAESSDLTFSSASADSDTELKPESTPTPLVCQPCQADAETVEASGFCQDCKVHLCGQCIRLHKRLPALRDHVLLEVDTVPKESIVAEVAKSELDVCTDNCSEHDGDIIKYFCTDHGCLGCGVCMTLDHRTCNIVYIPKHAKGMATDQEFITFRNKLVRLTQKSMDLEDYADDSIQRTESINAQVHQAVLDYRTEINEAIDRLERSVKDTTTIIKRRDKGKMSGVSVQAKSIKDELQRLSKTIETLFATNQFCKLFIEVKKTSARITALEAELSKHETETVSEYRFVKVSLDQITQQLQNAGKLKVRRNPKEVRCTFLKDIQIKSQNDAHQCDIVSSVVLSGGKLVVVDARNNNMKVLDIGNGAIVQKCILSDAWDMTMLGTNRLAVTQPTQKKITLLSIDASRMLGVDGEIQLSGECYGIASFQGKLAVTFRAPSRLEIMNSSGTTLNTFSKDQTGADLFSSPRHVTISADAQSIIVSDWEKSAVTSLSLDGEVNAVYRDSTLQSPQQVCVDQAGLVYVCCRNQNAIHLLTPSLKKIKVLRTEKNGSLRPKSISIHPETDQLYSGVGNSAQLKVFQLA